MELLPADLRGPRLVLRAWSPDDVDALSAAITASVDHLLPWMHWAAHEPMDRETRRQLIEGWRQERSNGGDATYAMFEAGVVVGGCGLHRRRGPDVLEIGYWVHAHHVGRGLATEAARMLTTAAFTVPGITRVEIHHDRANARSRAVPARLGFTFAGESPDEPSAPAEDGIDCTWTMSRPAAVAIDFDDDN